MATLLVIADDYTGAMDTGVQFAKTGASVLVSPDPEKVFESLAPDTDVLAADLEMRHDPPEEAARKVRDVLRRGLRSGIPYIYIKTDSTLRGNIGASLAAALDEWGPAALPFIPAYPKNGRTTKDGVHYVNGVPLAQTVFSADPLNPVRHSDIKSILGEQTGLPVKILSYGQGLLMENMPGPCICVFDAQSDDDLRGIARSLDNGGFLGMTAGCGGFAEVLPAFMKLPQRPPLRLTYGKKILLASGSVNENSIRQLKEARKLGFSVFSLAGESGRDLSSPAEAERFAENVAETLRVSGKAIVSSVESREQIREDVSQSPAQTLGSLARLILSKAEIDALVVFGGDTLIETMRTIGCPGLRPFAEITPGVVAARAEGTVFQGTVVTKAGGFGPPDTVGLILRYLKGLPAD